MSMLTLEHPGHPISGVHPRLPGEHELRVSRLHWLMQECQALTRALESPEKLGLKPAYRPTRGPAPVLGHPRTAKRTKKGPKKVDVRVGREKDVGGISGPADVDRCHRTRPLLRTCKKLVRNY
jgi:hypothetical protein